MSKIISKLNALKVKYTNLDEVNKMVKNIELDTFEIIPKITTIIIIIFLIAATPSFIDMFVS